MLRADKLNRRVGIAHDFLPQEINAVRGMPQRKRLCQVLEVDALAALGRFVHDVESVPHAVQTVQLMVDRQAGAEGGDLGVVEEAVVRGEEGAPGLVGLVGGCVCEGVVVVQPGQYRAD